MAWFVLDAVGQIDLQPFYEKYRTDGVGNSAFNPSLMVSLLMYSYCTGERFSRWIERFCQTDVAYKVITANQSPDHSTISRFRKDNESYLKSLFLEVLRLCAGAGLVKLGKVSLDGTKIKADASLVANRRLKHLEQEVEKMLSEAADLSEKINIRYVDRPFHTVLAKAPKMYDELWVAGKCMYKLEPVLADGGTLIIYGPHIEEVSLTHGELIEKAGYHVCEFFTKQVEKYADIPGGVRAHCTHVKGIGSYGADGEKPRVNVVLATKISPEVCERINLGYMNPDQINVADYQGKEDEGILYVPKAGEILYRLKNPPDWQKP